MRVVISAGPTREAIDPVRFISNRSTGRMGYALAAAAVARGMETVLVSGPVALPPPDGLFRLVRVETAAEMAEAMKREAGEAALIIMCAAVADYRPKVAAAQKMKKKSVRSMRRLKPSAKRNLTPNRKRADQLLVGFAAETDSLEQYALEKMRRKNLDWIAANRVGIPGQGFESETNAVVLYARSGEKRVLPLDSKDRIAEQILDIVVRR